MMTFTRLARISHDRRQATGRDRFLVLAGQEACQAGWLDIAESCRRLVLETNPHHFLSRSGNFPDALRDEANRGFLAKLDQFCSFEHAEHLLIQNEEPLEASEDVDAGQVARQELEKMAGEGPV